MQNLNNNARNILSGEKGVAIQAITLSSLNFQLSGMLVRHPSIKAPSNRGTVEDHRDLVKLPEMEGIEVGHTLDQVCDWLVASYLLTEQVRRTTDFDTSGRESYPFAYLKPVTPNMAIAQSFAWRAKMQGQELANKAILMGLKNAAEIAEKASKVADERNTEAKAYALAETDSATNQNMVSWSNEDLLDLLTSCPIDIEETAIAAAENSISRAKARLEQGLWASIDEEVILFAKNANPKPKTVA